MEMGRIIQNTFRYLNSDLVNLKYIAIENYDHYKEQYDVKALFSI